MEQVTGCGPAKQTLLDLVSRTNRTAVPFRVLLVGPSGIGKTLLGDILAAHYKPRRIDCGSSAPPSRWRERNPGTTIPPMACWRMRRLIRRIFCSLPG